MIPFLPLLVLSHPLTICIDPGHPSEVGRGTTGRKITEIEVAWKVAKRVQSILERTGTVVVLTKQSENQTVENVQRATTANRSHAGLMVRLHCDASSGTGFTTYYPDRQGTQNGFTGPSWELIRKTAPIARRFHEVLAADLKGFLKDNGLLSDARTAVGSRYGALIGSIHSEVPVVLVEMCVLTNRHDEALVSTDQGQQRLAQAIADASLRSIQ